VQAKARVSDSDSRGFILSSGVAKMALITNTLGIMFVRLGTSAPASGASPIGDWLSQQRAAQVLSMVTETVHRNGGIVMKSLSDSIIATFPAANSAYKAAAAMQEAILENNESENTQTSAGVQYNLSIALHLGQLVVAAGNISGDVVEEIATLAGESNAEQILASDVLVAKLRGETKALVKNVKARTMTLRGKAMDVYELPWGSPERDLAETARQAAPAKESPTPAKESPGPARAVVAPEPARAPSAGGRTLQLTYGSTHLDLDESSPTLTMGRSPKSRLVVKSPYISRTHAHIENSNGAFFLVNQSANGSCIRAQGGAEVHCTDRHELQGKGVIGLGPDFARCGEHIIEYRLL
jgi:adenylate cyclase